METQQSTPERHHATDPHAKEDISAQARFLMWLFVIAFIGFGLMLIGDLVTGLWR